MSIYTRPPTSSSIQSPPSSTPIHQHTLRHSLTSTKSTTLKNPPPYPYLHSKLHPTPTTKPLQTTCFSASLLDEECNLGVHVNSIIPASWVIKLPRKVFYRNLLTLYDIIIIIFVDVLTSMSTSYENIYIVAL